MDDKKLGLVFVSFAVVYFIFITTVAGHGVMLANVISAGVAFLVGIYYLKKARGGSDA